MGVSERATERAISAARARAEAEVRALVEAGLAVLRNRGAEQLTVAEVLREAGLSTRAFYRHFRSKDELVLAVYEHDARRTHARLAAELAPTASAPDALGTWIDETLALGFDSRRAKRTRVLAAEGARLQAEFPEEFASIVDGVLAPLVGILRELGSRQPELDARTVHAITWMLVNDALHGNSTITRAEAKAHVLRFCGPALGLGS